MLATVPLKLKALDPEPETVTPPPVVAAKDDPVAELNVTVILPAVLSASAIDNPVKATAVSSVVEYDAGAVFTGAMSLTSATVMVMVRSKVSPPWSVARTTTEWLVLASKLSKLPLATVICPVPLPIANRPPALLVKL